MPLDHFDLIAGLYDRLAQFAVENEFLDLLSLSADSLILDAGGGTGRVAAAFHGRNARFVIADPSLGMLRRASAKGLMAVCSPAETLPFCNESFSRIIMVDAFHHVHDQERVARELMRLLTPGGRILVLEPDIQRLTVKLVAALEKFLFMRSHFRSSDEIKELFESPHTKIRIAHDGNNVHIVVERVRRM
jgi:demethylmenaquinone methyltransferase/2-methoxy-6-polyprenyl-1,4-benzoquinol methylase